MPTNTTLGPFALERLIGEGGMAEVWRAQHVQQGTHVAFKFVRNTLAGGEDVDAEVAAMARLDHPGIVRIFDSGRTDAAVEALTEGRVPANSPYIAMELAAGALVDTPRPKRFSDLRSVLMQVGEGLAHAHARRIIHRDLKPENVLVFATPAGRVLKLTDFGIARAGERRPHQTGAMSAGTPAYMAPEMFEGRWRDYGPWTDLYAMGCLGWWLATGSPPFSGTMIELAHSHMRRALPAFTPDVPVSDGFEEWLRVLLRKPHQGRFACAADAIAALQELAVAEDVETEARPGEAAGATASFDSHPSYATLEPISLGISGARAALAREVRPPPVALGMPAQWPRRPVDGDLLPGTGLGLLGLRPIPFSGRVETCETLWDALRDVVARGCSRGLLLTGETGVGKSRLAGELAAMAAQLGLAVVVSTDFSGGGGGDGPGFRQLVHNAYGTHGLVGEELHRRISRLSREEDGDQLQGLTAWLSGGTTVSHHGHARVALQRMERSKPLCIVLDNVDQAPDALRFVEGWLQSAGPEDAVLFVGCWASPAGAPPKVDGLETLHLAPLPHRELHALLVRRIGLEPSFAERLVDRSDRNLLFVIELLLDLARQGAVQFVDGRLSASAESLNTLPTSIEAVWKRRLENAVPDEAGLRAVHIAATLGNSVDNNEWGAVARLADVPLSPQTLHSLFAHRLAEPHESGWRFAHGLLRETILRQSEAAGTLRDDHVHCANVLSAAIHGGHAARVALHLVAAGVDAGALEPLAHGIRQALGSASAAAAEALIRVRFSALERLHIGETDERWAETLRLATRAAFIADDASRGLETSAAYLAAATAAHPGHLAVATVKRAQALRMAGKLDESATLLAAGIKVARERNDNIAVIHACLAETTLQMHRGRADDARRLAQEAMDRCPVDHRLRVHCYTQLGWAAIGTGEYDLARECFTFTERHTARSGDHRTRGGALSFLGELHRKQGELTLAVDYYRRAAEARLNAGHRPTIQYLNLALTLGQLGDFDGARGACDACLEAAKGYGRPHFEAAALVIRAHARLRLGEGDEALRDAVDASSRLRPTGFVDPDLALSWRQLAEAASPETELAEVAWSEVRHQYESLGDDAALASLPDSASQ